MDDLDNSSSSNITIYVRHCDPNDTGEGLGSYARGSLYPLLRVALTFDWDILWHDQPGFGRQNQSRPFYDKDCKHLAEWLLLGCNVTTSSHERVPTFHDLDTNRLTVVPIDLENDGRLGRILGYAGILISSIQEYCNEHGRQNFFNLTHASNNDHPIIVLVSLNGRFFYQDDPSPQVVSFLQNRCNEWKDKDKKKTSEVNEPPSTTSVCMADNPKKLVRIAAHIRVPEDYCSQEWKDANSVIHMINTLQIIQQTVQNVWYCNRNSIMKEQIKDPTDTNGHAFDFPTFTLDIYTEEAFTEENESTLMALLKERLIDIQSSGPRPDEYDNDEVNTSNAVDPVDSTSFRRLFQMNGTDGSTDIVGDIIRFHKQTPLLDTVRGMATADIFIPASSYLSAFTGFFQTSLIVVPPEEVTRRQQYFQPHLSEKYRTSENDDKSVENENHKPLTIPIVVAEDEQPLNVALEDIIVEKSR